MSFFLYPIIFVQSIFIGCSQSEQEQIQGDEPVSVSLLSKVRSKKVHSQKFASKIELSAQLQAFRSAVLVPKSAGRISEVLVRIGDEVKEGDVLLEIEKQDYEIGLQEAQAAYQLALIQAEQAWNNQKRFATLLAEGAVTKVQFEEVQIGDKLAKAQAERALAGLDIAKSRLAETQLKAPFDGVIVTSNVEVGEMIGGPTQRPPLLIVDISKIRIQAEIPEGEMSNISVGQKIKLYLPSLGTTHDFTVERMNSALDPVVRTLQFEGILDNPTGILKHGMSGTVLIEGIQGTHISVPRAAILERQNNKGKVFVVQNNQVFAKEVTYGRSSDDNVPIYKGLLPDEEIVVSGHNRLKDGETVEVISRGE